MTKHGKEYSEDEYEDFNWLLREVLRLIVKWTDPDHPEGRYPKTPFKVNEDLVMKLEDMMEPRGSMQRKQLPEDIKNAILQITSQLYAIIDTIDNPKDPIWKSNPYPYNQPAK